MSEESETNEWAVDKIVSHYGRRSKALFEVLWKSRDRSWMPYEQAKRLQALAEYLEVVGVDDIKDLPYGSGNPPIQDGGMMVGLSMSHFWAHKDNERLEEFSTFPSAPAPMSHETHFYNPKYKAEPLSERHKAFNKVHPALKRIDKRYFRFEHKGLDAVLFDARMIRLYADYNVALCSGGDIPEVAPGFYLAFAQEMNAWDDSGYGWAYMENDVIVWDDKWTPADPESYCVLDHETTDHLLGFNEVAVDRRYYENAERLITQEQQHYTKYWKQRKDNHAKDLDHVPDVSSKEAKENFAKKRKALEDAAADAAPASAPASKKKKKAATPAGDGDADIS